METQALWDEYYSATWTGGPQGLGTVLDFAVRRHKPLAVSEWGLWGNNTAGDDPVYIRNMYQFFEQHANVLAYENYYDCGSLHELYPATLFPKASALYRQLWSAGQ